MAFCLIASAVLTPLCALCAESISAEEFAKRYAQAQGHLVIDADRLVVAQSSVAEDADELRFTSYRRANGSADKRRGTSYPQTRAQVLNACSAP